MPIKGKENERKYEDERGEFGENSKCGDDANVYAWQDALFIAMLEDSEHEPSDDDAQGKVAFGGLGGE